jgi:2-polyprenyl-3-methyl-5-hydroxy-6-metoxy-1,4-benzoquinol methylase
VRYRVKGLEIRSENAAKPVSQRSAVLVNWLRDLDPVYSVLDYGCGKLRYASILVRLAKSVTLVDGEIQLSRRQRVGGRLTNVRDYVKRWPNTRVLSVDKFCNDKHTYDFILCANVLSAIPTRRARSEVLRRLAERLSPSGRCLFTTQYRNTDFGVAAQSERAKPHLDGWLLTGQRGTFYYGLIDKQKLVNMAVRHGFRVEAAWTYGESAYVLTAKAVKDKRAKPEPNRVAASTGTRK